MIPPIDSTDSTEDSSPCKKLSDWMAQLPAHLTQIPISRLQIPGSHDSGADDSVSVDLPVANDDQGKLETLGKSKCVRQIIKKWAVTQRLDILEQLQAGIRYFDLRVSHPPEKVQEKAGDFLIVHALYGPLLSTVLLNIRTFLDQYTQEVVLLDFNHLYGMTEDSDVALTALIGRCLGWHRICPPMDPVDCTLDNLRQLGYKQVDSIYQLIDSAGILPEPARFCPLLAPVGHYQPLAQNRQNGPARQIHNEKSSHGPSQVPGYVFRYPRRAHPGGFRYNPLPGFLARKEVFAEGEQCRGRLAGRTETPADSRCQYCHDRLRRRPFRTLHYRTQLPPQLGGLKYTPTTRSGRGA